MKKLIALLIVATMLLGLFAACGRTDDTSRPAGTSEQPPTTTDSDTDPEGTVSDTDPAGTDSDTDPEGTVSDTDPAGTEPVDTSDDTSDGNGSDPVVSDSDSSSDTDTSDTTEFVPPTTDLELDFENRFIADDIQAHVSFTTDDGPGSVFTTRFGAFQFDTVDGNPYFSIMFTLDDSTTSMQLLGEIEFGYWLVRIEGFNYYVPANRVARVPYHSVTAVPGTDETPAVDGRTTLVIAFEAGHTSANPKFIPVAGEEYDITLAFMPSALSWQIARFIAYESDDIWDVFYYFNITAQGVAGVGLTDGEVLRPSPWVGVRAYTGMVITNTQVRLGVAIQFDAIDRAVYDSIRNFYPSYNFEILVSNRTAGADPTPRAHSVTNLLTPGGGLLGSVDGGVTSPVFYDGGARLRMEIIPPQVMRHLLEQIRNVPGGALASAGGSAAFTSAFVDGAVYNNIYDYAYNLRMNRNGQLTDEPQRYFFPMFRTAYEISLVVFDPEDRDNVYFEFTPIIISSSPYQYAVITDPARDSYIANLDLYMGEMTWRASIHGNNTNRFNNGANNGIATHWEFNYEDEDPRLLFDRTMETKMGVSNVAVGHTLVVYFRLEHDVNIRGFSIISANDNSTWNNRDANSFTMWVRTAALRADNATPIATGLGTGTGTGGTPIMNYEAIPGLTNVVQHSFDVNFTEFFFAAAPTYTVIDRYYALSFNNVRGDNALQYSDIYLWVAAAS